MLIRERSEVPSRYVTLHAKTLIDKIDASTSIIRAQSSELRDTTLGWLRHSHCTVFDLPCGLDFTEAFPPNLPVDASTDRSQALARQALLSYELRSLVSSYYIPPCQMKWAYYDLAGQAEGHLKQWLATWNFFACFLWFCLLYCRRRSGLKGKPNTLISLTILPNPGQGRLDTLNQPFRPQAPCTAAMVHLEE
jgi:hypothetical protein